LSNFETGILITFSVIVHEIPQEFGDFVILLHGGFKKKKALKLNFYSALSAIVGGVLGYFVFDFVNSIIPYAILVSAGGFLYLALSDIVPSMHEHEKDKKTRIKETIIFVLTLVFFKFFLNFVHVH
jgi:zinc and cadmium transporter